MDYEIAKELALLSNQIQEGYRELAAIKDEKDSYLAQREQEADERIAKALVTAKSAIDEANSYAKDVKELIKIASNVLLDIKAYKEAIKEEKRLYVEQVANTRKQIDESIKQIEVERNEMRQEKSQLEGLREEIEALRDVHRKEQNKITDDRNKLAAAMKVWKQKEMKIE